MAFLGKGKLIAAAGAAAACLLACAAQPASCGNGAAGFEQWKVEFAGKAKAAAFGLVQEPRLETRVVPRIPGGESLSQELGLRDRPGEVQDTRAVVVAPRLGEAVERHCSARRGEAARQLHRGGHRGREEDDGGHGAAREAIR